MCVCLFPFWNACFLMPLVSHIPCVLSLSSAVLLQELLKWKCAHVDVCRCFSCDIFRESNHMCVHHVMCKIPLNHWLSCDISHMYEYTRAYMFRHAYTTTDTAWMCVCVLVHFAASHKQAPHPHHNRKKIRPKHFAFLQYNAQRSAISFNMISILTH